MKTDAFKESCVDRDICETLEINEDYWNEEAKEFLNKLLYKNIIKFAIKFNLGICFSATAEDQYNLLKINFMRVFPNLNFYKEWQKVVED